MRSASMLHGFVLSWVGIGDHFTGMDIRSAKKSLLPAVPTEDGAEMYGFTSVPRDREDWWRALPN